MTTICGTCPTCGGTTRATCASFPLHGHAWCECGKKDGLLPITVIIPHLRSRDWFYNTYCLPSVTNNKPRQILTVPGEKIGAQAARNYGAEQAKQPLLFHCDDDARLLDNCLPAMYAALEQHPEAGFVYSDHEIVQHASMSRSRFVAGPFDRNRLRLTSYISTMSLMRREVFRPWDPSIRRLQDWDFWLTIVSNGIKGIYIPDVLFEMHTIDKGITATWTAADWQRVVREKHDLPEPS